MRDRLKLLIFGICLALAGAAGCSSAPDVPEESEAHSYQSTQDDAEAETQSSQAPAAGAQGAEAEAPAELPRAVGPVAEVDGEPVEAEVFNAEIEKIARSGQLPPQYLHQLKDQVIEKIVDKVLIDKAVAEADISVEDQQVEKRMQEIQAEFDAANQQAKGQMGTLDDMVEQLGISKEEFLESVRESLAIEQLLIDRGMNYPGDEEVEAFYEANKESFQRPAQVHARHILLKVEASPDDTEAWDDAEERAAQVHQKAAESGADFEALAAEFSEGPLGKENGGDLGWFERGAMVPEFEEAAFNLEKGAVSAPVRTQFGWHIIQKVDEREEGVAPFEEIADQLSGQMRNERVQEALSELLAALRDSHEVVVHLENVQ